MKHDTKMELKGFGLWVLIWLSGLFVLLLLYLFTGLSFPSEIGACVWTATFAPSIPTFVDYFK